MQQTLEQALPRSSAMAFSSSRLIGAILGFSLTVFAIGLFDARAQETAAAPATAGACPNDGAAAFADALNKPHWNGWGVNSSQHRFQPADMARLAPSDVARLKLKWAFGFRAPPGQSRSRRFSVGACLSGARMEKSIRSTPKAGARIGSSTQASPFDRPSSSARAAMVGRRISAILAQTCARSMR